MRRSLHVLVCCALLAAFERAPGDHFHVGDPDHDHAHHAAGLAHEDTDAVEIEPAEHDADACLKHWLAGDGTEPGTHEIELTCCPMPDAPTARSVFRMATDSRSHDPPQTGPTASRAPPQTSYLV